MIATMVSDRPQRPAPPMPAVVTFFGPDSTFSRVRAVNPNGIEVASFTVESTTRSDFTILRQVSPNTAPVTICTGHKSSLSSSTTMNVHGQEIKFAIPNMTNYIFETPQLGKLTWKASSGGKQYEVIDSAKQVVAHADLQETKLMVFVPGDEIMLDQFLAGWVALVRARKKSADEGKQMATAFKIIGHLAGGVGGAGG